jgi:hypothetical protein
MCEPQAGRGSAAGNGGGYAGKRSRQVFPVQCGLKLP